MKIFDIEFDDIRLDRFIRKNFSEFVPQSLIEKLSRLSMFKLDGISIKPNTRLKKNDILTVYNTEVLEKFRNPTKSILNIEKFKKIYRDLLDEIIYEDESLIAFNKPNNLAVQGGVNVNISMDDLFKHFYKYKEASKKLHIVHRLDRATSGVIIFAKGYENATFLSKLFHEKLISKVYIALCNGIFTKKSDNINSKIWEGEFSNEHMCMSGESEGKDASTDFIVIEENSINNVSLVKLMPKTGRKHQLRVHMKYIGHPIIGDTKYSNNIKNEKSLFLHAQSLKFILKGKQYNITTSKPDKFDKYIK